MKTQTIIGLAAIVLFLVFSWPCESAFAGRIVACGANLYGQCEVPPGCDYIAISGGHNHSLALRSDGSVVAWGRNPHGQCNVPKGNDFVAIAAGRDHSLALKSDGSLVAWGWNEYGQCDVPAGNDFMAVTCKGDSSFALRSDGSIVKWDIFPDDPPDGNDFTAIAIGSRHKLALRSDGSLVAWGSNEYGQCNVPDGNDFVAIACGYDQSLALKSDGTILAWGQNSFGQCDVPNGNDFVAIAAGAEHGLALKSDGSLVAWGNPEYGCYGMPAISGFDSISAGYLFSLAIYKCPLGADLTGDYHVDIQDLRMMAAGWLATGNMLIADLHEDNKVDFKDYTILADKWQRHLGETGWYVSPDGSPSGDGSAEDPWDLDTALFDLSIVRPGDTVWLAGGTYTGPFVKAAEPSGAEDAPIIYRAIPGQKVTLTASTMDKTALENHASYVWFWGFEVTADGDPNVTPYGGGGVDQMATKGCKYINMVVHDSSYRNGFGAWGIGGEYYGCLSYRNGTLENAFFHGFYCQNRPDDVGGSVDDLPWMELLDCLVFNNYGYGIHTYGSSPRLANILYEGVVAYGNQECNFLSGGLQHDDNFVIRNCFTYSPAFAQPDGGAGFGYRSPTNGMLTIENSLFVEVWDAVHVNNWEQVTFRNNTCYTTRGHIMRMLTPDDVSQYIVNNNMYYQGWDLFTCLNDIHYYTLEAWQAATGWDTNSKHIIGRPTDAWVFLRPNKYEPDRAHLIIYNWPKTETVSVEMAELWPENGQHYNYRIVNVEDIWGEPASEGTLNDGVIEVPMTGVYAPEFACYLVTRRIP